MYHNIMTILSRCRAQGACLFCFCEREGELRNWHINAVGYVVASAGVLQSPSPSFIVVFELPIAFHIVQPTALLYQVLIETIGAPGCDVSRQRCCISQTFLLLHELVEHQFFWGP